MLRLLILFGVGALGLMPLVANADEGQTSPPAAPEPVATVRQAAMIIETVTLDDLRLLVDEVHGTFSVAGANSSGAPFVIAHADDGTPFGIYTACAGTDGMECRGVEFLAVIETSFDWLEVASLDRMYPAVSIYQAEVGRAHVSRYVILDGGVTWGNLLENANVFKALSGQVVARLTRPTIEFSNANPSVDVHESADK